MLFFGATSPQAKLDCSEFKTGSFKMLNENKKEESVTVERTSSFQFEHDEASGQTTKLSIGWTDDCTYYLEYIEGFDGMEKTFQGRKLWVKIIEVKGKMYKYAAWFAGEEEQKIYGWIKKIE